MLERNRERRRKQGRLLATPVHQQGVALLTVLFILVLLSTLAIYTAEDENMAFRRLENQRDAAQSHQVALAGEQWVIKTLERDLLDTSSTLDYLGEEWAQLQSQVVRVESGEMAVQAVDESGKFNINNMLIGKTITIPNPDAATASTTPIISVESPWYGLFARLLNNVGLDESLAEAVVDWVDDDDEVTGQNGAEDSDYSAQDPPYLAANQAFSSVSELALVKGFDQQALSLISPYVSALPVGKKNYTKINLNTAPAMILQSLDDVVDALAVNALSQLRIVTPFNSPSDVYAALSLALERRNFDAIADVRSEFFSAESCAKYGRISYAQKSLLWRDKAKEEVHVLSRQRRYNCGVNIGLNKPANTQVNTRN